MAKPARFETFDKDIQLATAGLEPDKIAPALAAFAKAELARVIASGEASSNYTRFVNGREGASEASVKVPGPILYAFSYWDEILKFALDFLASRAPRASGDFVNSIQVRIGGQLLGRGASVGLDETVTLVATVPYARKIEVGHMNMSVPHLVFDDARKAVQSRYGALVAVRKRMMTLPGGYVLRGHFTRGVRPHSRLKLHKDTQAGQPVTYPALDMTMKSFV